MKSRLPQILALLLGVTLLNPSTTAQESDSEKKEMSDMKDRIKASLSSVAEKDPISKCWSGVESKVKQSSPEAYKELECPHHEKDYCFLFISDDHTHMEKGCADNSRDWPVNGCREEMHTVNGDTVKGRLCGCDDNDLCNDNDSDFRFPTEDETCPEIGTKEAKNSSSSASSKKMRSLDILTVASLILGEVIVYSF